MENSGNYSIQKIIWRHVSFFSILKSKSIFYSFFCLKKLLELKFDKFLIINFIYVEIYLH